MTVARKNKEPLTINYKSGIYISCNKVYINYKLVHRVSRKQIWISYDTCFTLCFDSELDFFHLFYLTETGVRRPLRQQCPG